MKRINNVAYTINWILLGLLMLIAGLFNLLSFDLTESMLSGLGFPTPTFFAWILIIAEIGSGVAILTKWKIKYVVFLPIIILVVAAFTTSWGDYSNVLLHLLAASNYWLFSQINNK